MNIDIKDTITLSDDNKYLVVSKINYNNVNHYYLIDINDESNILFCYEDNDELVENIDKELVTKLLPLFFNEVKDELNTKEE